MKHLGAWLVGLVLLLLVWKGKAAASTPDGEGPITEGPPSNANFGTNAKGQTGYWNTRNEFVLWPPGQ